MALVTLKNIAEIAKVDVGSVSCTLRNHPKAKKLRQETRERILMTAKTLGYRHNALAASIRTGKNLTIALIHDFLELQTNQVLSGILDEATNLGFGVKLYSDDNLDHSINEIISNRLQYIIATSTNTSKRKKIAAFCKKYDIELVFIYDAPCDGFTAVDSDNFNASRMAVEHLVKLGHSKISFIGRNCSESICNQDRYDGYIQGMKDASIDITLDVCCCDENNTINSVEYILGLAPAKRPTAFFCIDPGLAYIVIRKVYAHGLQIPKDFSLITFGNYQQALNEVAILNPFVDNADYSSFFVMTRLSESFKTISRIAVRVVVGEECDIQPSESGMYKVPCSIFEDVKYATCAKIR